MTRRGRPPRGTAGLSRAAVVEATLRVLDTEGAAAVGMRSVARVLGVDPKSLYNHVADKEDLLDAVAEHLLAGLELPEPTGDPGRDLHAIADSFRVRALRHPQAAPLVLTRQLGSLEGLAPVDAVLTVLLDAGAPAGEAVHLLRMLLATLVGTLLREVSAAPAFGDPDGSRQSVLAGSGLPAVASLAAELARFDRRAEFEYGVGLAVRAVLDRIADLRRAE